MNLSANILGLDNAATPLGIKAMRELQSLNPKPDTASDAQILFFVINASSITLFPISILAFRAQMGAAHPGDVVVPILMATFCSTLAGFASVALRQPLAYAIGRLAYIGGFRRSRLGVLFGSLNQDGCSESASLAIFAFSLIALFPAVRFVIASTLMRLSSTAPKGFHTAITILPYLVAMLVAVGVLRASGLLDAIMSECVFFARRRKSTALRHALPTALIKPFSGSGAR